MSESTGKVKLGGQTDAGALHELSQIRFDLGLMGPGPGDTREHVQAALRDRDEACAQRDELARNMREMVDRCKAALAGTPQVPPKDE